MRGVAAGQQLAVEQQGLARLPAGDVFRSDRVQIDTGALGGVVGDLRPVFQRRRVEHHRATAIQGEVRMAGGRAVRDHRHRQIGGVGREVLDLDVQHGGQAAQALRTDAQRVDLVEQLQAQLFGAVGGATGLELVDVDRLHQRFLGQQHRLLGGAADADAEHARRAPAGAHGRHGLEYPVHDRVGRVEHGELALGFRTAALGRDDHLHGVTWHHLDVDHARRVVLGVDALACRIGQHRGAQLVVRVVVGAAHAFVGHVLHAHGGVVPAHVHADFQEHGDDAGVLADRPVAFGAHARIDQDLGHRLLRGRRLFALIGSVEALDVIDRVVVRDVLQRVGDGLDEVFLLDRCHDLLACWRLAGVEPPILTTTARRR